MEVGDEEEKVHYQLTEKGVNLTHFITSFDLENNEVQKEMLNEVIESEENVENWIDDWLQLFPSDKHFGRSLRTNSRDCLDRMRWFLANFKFSKEEVMEATKNYIESQRTSPEGFKFARNSTYFILKGRGNVDRTSELATECEKLKDLKPSLSGNLDRDSV